MIAKVSEYRKESAYRYYVTDCLNMIAENTARYVGKGGRYCKGSFRDLISPKKEEPLQDARKLVDSLTKKMNLVVTE